MKKLDFRKKRLLKLLSVALIFVVVFLGFYFIKTTLDNRQALAEDKEAAVAESASSTFIDISQPQCPTMRTIARRSFGIVGLNGTYLAFGVNPCLKKQVNKFNYYDFYVGTNYPSSHCPRGESPYNCGVRAANFDLYIIVANKLKPGAIWIDVESGERIPWSSQSNNREFLRGMRNRFRQDNRTVGFYSNTNMWNSITGGWNHESYSWYASAQSNASKAHPYCSRTFGGGKTVYVQYVDRARNIDKNVKCG